MSESISYRGLPHLGGEPLRKLASRIAFGSSKLAGASRVACAFSVWLLASLPAHAGTVDVALVFAVDYSSSVDREIADMQREGHAAALTSPEIIRAITGNYFGCISVTYLEWSSPGQTRVVLPWTNICRLEEARVAAKVIRTKGDRGYVRRARSGTSISSAIDVAGLLLDQFPGKAMRKVIDISANGENNDGLPVGSSRDRAIAKGYTINAIAIPDRDDDHGRSLATYFADNVIGGSYAFVMKPAGPGDFVAALRRKLSTEISFNLGSLEAR